ncbi:MAG TPA: hypothetical protein DD706_05125, partial [Nitrospiraceae bacterium]|nr:hypothetical protein [Nitrospiraceae bacterium]
MYFKFFGLQTKPFQITPDPEFLYLSPGHKQALGSLIYGVKERKGFIAVTGQVGLGKTTILRSFLTQMDQADHQTIYLLNPNLTFTHLLKTLLRELGHNPIEGDDPEVLEQLHMVLIEHYRKGKTVVLLIDEAQNMPLATLEQLRILSNLETPKDKLIQIVLLGQPELDVLLDRYELRQLRQRIAVRATIRPLSKQESLEYIRHRLDTAGGEGKECFTKSALGLIVREARGIPRRLNILCDNAMVTACGYNKSQVTAKIAKEVINDLTGRSSHSLWKLVPLAAGALLLVLAIVTLIPMTQSSVWDISLKHEIRHLFKDEANPNSGLLPGGENIHTSTQDSLTLTERGQIFLTESVPEGFETLRKLVGSNSNAHTIQPDVITSIDPDQQEDLVLAQNPVDDLKNSAPVDSEESNVSAAPGQAVPIIQSPQQELFDLSGHEEELFTNEARIPFIQEPTFDPDATKTQSENPNETNLPQLDPENLSEHALEPTVLAEELEGPTTQESFSSGPNVQPLVPSQEMTKTQTEVAASASPFTKIVKKGDTMAKLLHEVYGSASTTTLRFVLDHNRHIANGRKIYPGQQIMFPPLGNVEDQPMVAEAERPVLADEDKE